MIHHHLEHKALHTAMVCVSLTKVAIITFIFVSSVQGKYLIFSEHLVAAYTQEMQCRVRNDPSLFYKYAKGSIDFFFLHEEKSQNSKIKL